jgi:hypothetical protein
MKLIKTTAGQNALNQRDRTLNVRLRQVLIMVNGTREFEDFPAIFGREVIADLKQLAALGFVIQTPENAKAKDFTETGTFDASRPFDSGLEKALAKFVLPAVPAGTAAAKRPVLAASAVDNVVIGAAAPMGVLGPRVPSVRRSLAAAKMYTVDMLSMFKHVDAPSYIASIQTSESEAELVANITAAMLFLQFAAEPSFAAKVIGRVSDLLPEALLPHFGAVAEPLMS